MKRVLTEIGWLPEDWEVVRLEDQFKTFSTASYSREQMSEQGEVLCVHYGDIHTIYGNIVDANIDAIPHITTQQAARYKKLKDGDILLADASEDDEGIGKPIVIICHDKQIIAGLHILPLRPKNGELWDIQFPSYLFSGRMVKGQVERLSEGTKVNSITYNKIKDVLVPRPTDTTEQQSIASALSSMDKLIDDLGRTIEKKRNIREGAMEELLSGKKRLPGFTEEWVEKNIGEVCNTASGGTPNRSNPNYYTGKIKWYTTTELNDCWLTDSLEHITEEALHNSSAKIFKQGTLLMAMYGATIGKLGILASEAATNQACCAFESKGIDLFYLFYNLLYQRPYILSLGVGAGQPNISQQIIKNISIPVPDLKEQHAIADILTSMDDEISVLQSERAKYEQIRAGMMDELLTGAKRLI